MKKICSSILLIIVCILAGSCSCSNAPAGRELYSIEEGDGYVTLTLADPWNPGKVRGRFVLVPRGNGVPEGLPDGIVIRTPVERAVVYTAVHASLIEQIGALDAICGVCEPQYLTNESVKSAVADGRIVGLGLSTSPDIESIIDLDADLIIATPFENSGYGAAEKLGIPIFEASDYMENTPLGRASWVKLFGLLFGREAAADSLFEATVRSYGELKSLAASASSRPTLLLERKYGATWGVPCKESYIAHLHADAGADYIFKNVEGTASRQYSFEQVYDEAAEADFWLMKHNTTGGSFTYGDLSGEYQPYSNFSAFRNRHIYACNTVETPYYDDIAIHPDWILKDFIKIFHPELLPDYELRYYKPLDE